jgi:hypothetical protein
MTVDHWDIAWEKGGYARVVSIGADTFVVLSTVPSPPGSRIGGVLRHPNDDAAPATVKMKIHSSRLQENGQYLLEGRPLDLAKPLRERLLELAQRAPGSQGNDR